MKADMQIMTNIICMSAFIQPSVASAYYNYNYIPEWFRTSEPHPAVEPESHYEEPTPHYEEPTPHYEEPAPHYEKPTPHYEEPHYNEPEPYSEEPQYKHPDHETGIN